MTTPYYEDDLVTVHAGDCLDVLAALPAASVDAVVTDPPYGLEFMGKDWDAPWARGTNVNADAGFSSVAMSDGFERLPRPSFTGSTNPVCQNCGGKQRGRKDATAIVRACAPCDAPRFPNVRAVEMRAFQDWCEAWSTECLRVLKSGGYLLAFGGSRTWHRLAAAVEDAGFEVRDSIAWLYGSGFPKSLDVSKAIDKAAGHSRGSDYAANNGNAVFGKGLGGGRTTYSDPPITDAAQQWAGWGTALKPAFEPIVVGRKPLDGTVAANVLAHGVGALNIDACRTLDAKPDTTRGASVNASSMAGPLGGQGRVEDDGRGRWPTNVILDETQAAALDAQSGTSKSSGRPRNNSTSIGDGTRYNGGAAIVTGGHDDAGGASRFFPVFGDDRERCPTCGTFITDRNERNADRCHSCVGNEPSAGPTPFLTSLVPKNLPTFHYEAKAPATERPRVDGVAHPTVKPLDLMRWLVRLVTPRGGVVLDPFLGSGTTAEACVLEGFRCIGIEREATYLPLAVARLSKPLAVGFDFGEVSS